MQFLWGMSMVSRSLNIDFIMILSVGKTYKWWSGTKIDGERCSFPVPSHLCNAKASSSDAITACWCSLSATNPNTHDNSTWYPVDCQHRFKNLGICLIQGHNLISFVTRTDCVAMLWQNVCWLIPKWNIQNRVKHTQTEYFGHTRSMPWLLMSWIISNYCFDCSRWMRQIPSTRKW